MQSETGVGVAPKRLIFIGGAEGSGTTLLLRLLAAPDACASLGGNYIKVPKHPEARALARAFNVSNRRLWDRQLARVEHEQARRDVIVATDRVVRSAAFSRLTHLLFKRSSPFALPRERHTPDIWDVLDLQGEARVVIVYRDPRAASFSALRREFDSDIRRLAVICAEQLTLLAAQAKAMDGAVVRIVSYKRLCQDPLSTLEPLADFCGIPFDAVRAAALDESIDGTADDRYRRELGPAELNWLEKFFDARRRRQWEFLESAI